MLYEVITILIPYAAFAKRIFRSHYLRKGWLPVV